MPTLLKFAMLFVFMVIVSGLFYYCFHRRYRKSPDYFEKVEQLSIMIENNLEKHEQNCFDPYHSHEENEDEKEEFEGALDL